MKVVDRIASAWRFLTVAEQRAHAPVASEAAVREIAQRMGVLLPGSDLERRSAVFTSGFLKRVSANAGRTVRGAA